MTIEDTRTKAVMRAVIPEPALSIIRAIRSRRHSHRLNVEWGITPLSERLLQTLGPRVRSGPFTGLILPSMATPEHLGPCLLGTYEHELHDVWRQLAESRPALVVNVGAKFGYYAVGFARFFDCRVVAFDPDPWARRATRETARLNGVTNVAVYTRCTRAWLAAREPGTLVVIDCDGCEIELLRLPLPVGLRHAILVVEVHEAVVSGSKNALLGALEATHEIVVVPSTDVPQDIDVDLGFLTDRERELVQCELRPPQSWLIARPKTVHTSSNKAAQ